MKRLIFIAVLLFSVSGLFAAQNPVVVMKTSMGTVEIALYAEKAPVTVANFLSYVDKGFYNGTIFHRVIGNFMIQGGGLTPGMQQKSTSAPIKNEADNRLSNSRGTIAMARTQEIHSATSQFFNNVVDNKFLDYKSSTAAGYGYCVFGKVINGMEVVDRIRSVQTGSRAYFQDVPVTEVVIQSIQRKR
jgi:cyclophilin family peptidyl-prolyl cis-trans isomerase